MMMEKRLILKVKKQLMRFVLLGLLMQSSHMAYALCYVIPPVPQDVLMNVGRVLITPSDKVGDILATGTFNINGNDNAWTCIFGGAVYGVIKQGAPSNLGNNIWTTNITGIGIRLYRQYGTSLSTYYPHSFSVGWDENPVLGAGYFKVDIVKIADQTGTGSIAPGLYSTYYADGTGEGRPILTSHVLANSITIVTSSCGIDAGSKNIAVNFRTVPSSIFKGVGSTADERSFGININCVGGVGTEMLPGGTGEGLVNLRFDYTPDTSNAPGVIKSVTGNDAASGVGIQLLNGNTLQPIKNGESVYAGHTIANRPNSISLPLRARYYQTADKIKGGNINSIATFTLEYN